MGLRKEITLTIKDYNIKLDKDIKFYRNDTIDLCFSILEYGIEVENSIVRSKLMPINTLNAYMYIETPEGTDYVDVTEIDENRVIFKLGTKYSQFVGVGKMQIVIIDNDGCRVTLPSFPFEIKESINSNIGVETPSLGTENGGIIFDEFGHIINPTKISELKEVETLPSNSYAMIIDEEGNKKIKVDTMLDGKIDKVEGLSLVSDTEIARLASVDNYDDAEIRSSLTILESRINSLGEGDGYATKSDLDGKVDKIDGHSLVANTEIEKLAKIDKIPTRLSDLDNNILVTLCENAEVDSGNILGYDKLNNIIVPNGDIEVTLELMNANGIETLTFETSDFTEVKDNTWNIVNYDENGDLIEYAVYIANNIEEQKIILEIYYGTDWDTVMVIKATIKQWQKEVKITSSDVDNVGYESLIRVPSAIEHLAQGKTEGLPTMIYNRLAFGRRNMLRFSEYTVEDMSQTPFIGGIYGKVSTQSSIYGKAINITHTYAEGGINSKGVMLNVTKNKYYSVYFGEQATHSIMGLVVTITDAEGRIIFEHTVNRVPSFGGLHTFISSTETIYVLFAIDRNITNARQIGLYDGMICICDTQEFNNHMNLVYYDNEIEYTPTSDYNPTTKKYVDDLLSNANIDVDLSDYYSKAEVDSLLSDMARQIEELSNTVANLQSQTVVLSQTDYEQLENKDANTLYFIR